VLEPQEVRGVALLVAVADGAVLAVRGVRLAVAVLAGLALMREEALAQPLLVMVLAIPEVLVAH
jgi:hypothetical protein